MKSTIYTILTTALVILTGCSKHSVEPDQLRSYIFFEPKVSESKVTKTSLLEGNTLPDNFNFGVLGYHGESNKTQLFENNITKVYKNSDGNFTYGNLVPWIDRENHYFYAFYIHGKSYENSIADVKPNNGNPYISYSQPENMSDMYDILTAYTQTKKIPFVPLSFQHRLWALDVKIKNSQTEIKTSDGTVLSDGSLSITSIKLCVSNIAKTVEINLAGGENIKASKDIEYNVSSTTVSVDANYEDFFGTLLFVPGGEFKYRVEVGYVAGGKYTGSFSYPSSGYATANNLVAGYRYNLKVEKLNDEFFVGLIPTGWIIDETTHTFE